MLLLLMVFTVVEPVGPDMVDAVVAMVLRTTSLACHVCSGYIGNRAAASENRGKTGP